MTVSPAENGTADRTPGQKTVALWLLALITLTGTLAMHIFVPALPLVAAHFDATAGATQLTLSAYIVGLAVAQVAYGPFSDRYGRRPVLMVGMLLYAAASLFALGSTSIDMLIVARFFEGLGGGAGLVLGRAIVRDTNTGEGAARKLSTMNLMVVAGPGLSPVIGSMLAAISGWRIIFVALGVLGLVNFYLVWRRLPETAERKSHDAPPLLKSYGKLLRSPRFIGFVLGGSFATTAIYAFVGAAPFIFVQQLHRPAHEVGAYLALNFVGTWIGSLTASRMIGRVPPRILLIGGNLIGCVGAIVFLALVLVDRLSVPGVVLPMILFSFGVGIASPMALSEALSVNPSIAGSASGIYGCVQMAIGALCAAAGGLGGNPALAAGTTLFVAGCLAQVAFFAAGRIRR
ncbi:multidrug effflux MFS transporter [Rhizobium sp. BR 250]